MVQPIDYLGMMQPVNPAQQLMQGLQVGVSLRGLRDQQIQQQQAQERALQYQRDLQSVFANPTAQGFAQLTAMYPEQREAFKQSWDTLSAEQQKAELGAASRVFGALNANRPDMAEALLTERIEALKNANQPTTEEEGILEIIRTDPNRAKGYLGVTLASIVGPEKFAESFGKIGGELREQEMAPARQMEAESTALLRAGEAEAAPGARRLAEEKTRVEIQNVRSQMDERLARIGLDRDRFNLDFDTKLEELRQKREQGGVPALSAGMEKIQADVVAKSLSSNQMASRASQLADAIEAEGQWGGAASWFATKAKEATGFDGGLPALRREFNDLVNRNVIDSLPPGVASDRDIALAREGFPTANASQQYLTQWLRAFSNVQRAASVRAELQANWISEVGSMRTAPRDLNVNGVQVPAGTSFVDFVKRYSANQQAQQPSATRPRYLDPSTWRR